ncbi:unnamed protein product, partial [Rotaria socialis]
MVPVLIINDERVSYSDPIFAAVRSGQILSYDYYDNHLDDSSKIIDDALELRNFQLADDYPRISRPVAETTDKNIEVIRALIDENPHIIIRYMAFETGLSY